MAPKRMDFSTYAPLTAAACRHEFRVSMTYARPSAGRSSPSLLALLGSRDANRPCARSGVGRWTARLARRLGSISGLARGTRFFLRRCKGGLPPLSRSLPVHSRMTGWALQMVSVIKEGRRYWGLCPQRSLVRGEAELQCSFLADDPGDRKNPSLLGFVVDGAAFCWDDSDLARFGWGGGSAT
jgi:hypothetical protein